MLDASWSDPPHPPTAVPKAPAARIGLSLATVLRPPPSVPSFTQFSKPEPGVTLHSALTSDPFPSLGIFFF